MLGYYAEAKGIHQHAQRSPEQAYLSQPTHIRQPAPPHCINGCPSHAQSISGKLSHEPTRHGMHRNATTVQLTLHINTNCLLQADPSHIPARSMLSHPFYDTALSPNSLTKLDDYLDSLAAVATTEQSTLHQLINTMHHSHVASLTASLASLTSAYALLAATKLQGPSATTTPSCPPLQLDPLGY